MNVCFIDVDSKIPNLALMKASTYHKSRGDSVKLGYEPLFDKPDLCYISKVFSYSHEPAYIPDCEIIRGGTGYNASIRMPFDDGTTYDRIMPDYALYAEKFPNVDYALGRFTRGCPNNCPWCVVPSMDGRNVRKVADLKDFWNGQSRVRLLDDNIMANKAVFIDACEQLEKAGVETIFDALDIRFVTDETAAALSRVKRSKTRLHFAWDSKAQERFINPGIETLKRNGILPYRLTFYVLIGFNTSREYDLYRIRTLDALGAESFVMPYDHKDEYQKRLARWCNNKIIFRSVRFEDYEPSYRKG